MDINGVEFEMESDISIPELSNDDLDIVCKSDIFRATISLKLVINDSNVMVENDTDYVSFCKKDKDNKYINIISSTELSNIIKIVNRYCGGSSIDDISFNGTQLFDDIISNSETKNLLLSSSAIRVIIGTSLETGTYSLLVETKEVAVLSHHDISREGAATEARVFKLN